MTSDYQLISPDGMNGPWGWESRIKLVELACEFFSFVKIRENHELIGKKLSNVKEPMPLTIGDFLKYLEVRKAYSKKPNVFRVAEIISKMAFAGILAYAGRGKRALAGLDDYYLYFAMDVEARRGRFRFVSVLGPEFLFHLCAKGLVHITGTNSDGDVVAGTGLVIHPSYVLTCGHVVSDMKVDKQQEFQGQECAVNKDSIHVHDKVDIAIICVDGPPLSPLPGAIFQAPVVAQTVYTLGYPKLAGLRDASVTMQPGAVTNESVTSLSGDELFLYSAISRPGNSGGPVISGEGYLVGLSVVDATGRYRRDEAFSPHYMGIPAQVVVKAVEELCLGIQLPLEDYE